MVPLPGPACGRWPRKGLALAGCLDETACEKLQQEEWGVTVGLHARALAETQLSPLGAVQNWKECRDSFRPEMQVWRHYLPGRTKPDAALA